MTLSHRFLFYKIVNALERSNATLYPSFTVCTTRAFFVIMVGLATGLVCTKPRTNHSSSFGWWLPLGVFFDQWSEIPLGIQWLSLLKFRFLGLPRWNGQHWEWAQKSSFCTFSRWFLGTLGSETLCQRAAHGVLSCESVDGLYSSRPVCRVLAPGLLTGWLGHTSSSL